MSRKSRSEHEIVDEALNLDGNPESIRRFYDAWAEKYDKDVVDIAYSGPATIAGLMDKHAVQLGASGRETLRILDAGCGTGLSGEALYNKGFRNIHGFDLSPEMAERAAKRDSYTSAVGGVDMMKAADHFEPASFDAVVSVGVITLGHVPPEALEVLIRLVRPGGLVALSTRIQYFDESNYQQVVEDLTEAGQIRLLEQIEDANYTSDGAGHFWAYQVVRS